jgi:hypothetical protein
VCMRVFIGVSARTCMSICVCIVFLKKILVASRFTSVQVLFFHVVDCICA